MQNLNVKFTLITSKNPEILAKKHYINDKNEYCCETSAHMSAGIAETITVNSANEFAEILKNANTNNAICSGITNFDKVNIVSQHLFSSQKNTITRTKEYFHFNENTPGILILDYDPPKNSEALSKEEFIKAIVEIIPNFHDYAYVWTTSSSSLIYNNNIEINGITGQRLYLFIQNSADIPRAGKNLHDRLWLNKHGYFTASKSGQALERSIIDTSVWQPNHLDFISGAHCMSPLTQKLRSFEINEGKLLDTNSILSELTEYEIQQLHTIKKQKKLLIKDEISSKQQNYKREISLKILQHKKPNLTESAYTAEETLDAELLVENSFNKVLMGDFIITLHDQSEITVNEILKNPKKYHNILTLDPLEPEYKNLKVVGKLYLNSHQKILHSFARGGSTYRLRPSVKKIQNFSGQMKKLTDQTLKYMKKSQEFFDSSDQLVAIDENQLITMNRENLSYYLSNCIQYFTINDKNEQKYINPPIQLINQLLSINRKLNKISVVTDTPMILINGEIISSYGYHEEHEIFISHMHDNWPNLTNITKEQLTQSINDLILPFCEFSFKTSLDFSVTLAAILTAITRPILPTAPSFAIDAPTQGTGKSYLSQCLSILATDKSPSTFPPTSAKNDDELRKRLTSSLLANDRAILFDNIIETFDSPTLATFLTNEEYSDRVLNQSKNMTFNNKLLVLITGNNIEFAGDMLRRVLKCRLDTQMQDPTSRQFSQNPLEYIKKNRYNLVIAGLTIIKAYFESKYFLDHHYKNRGQLASFESWDRLVRHPILWLSDTIDNNKFQDPINSIKQSMKSDPNTQIWALILYELKQINELKEKWLEAKEIFQMILNSSNHLVIIELLQDLLNTDEISHRNFGKALGFRKDKVVNNLRIIQKQSSNRNRYKLEIVNDINAIND